MEEQATKMQASTGTSSPTVVSSGSTPSPSQTKITKQRNTSEPSPVAPTTSSNPSPTANEAAESSPKLSRSAAMGGISIIIPDFPGSSPDKNPDGSATVQTDHAVTAPTNGTTTATTTEASTTKPQASNMTTSVAAEKNRNTMWALPLILSDMNVAADHPGLMQLVDSVLKKYEGRGTTVKKEVVEKSIDKILNEIKPVIFLEMDVKEKIGERTIVTNTTKKMLKREDVLPGGRYRDKLESKVRKCVQRISINEPKRGHNNNNNKSSPLVCNEELDANNKHFQHKTKIQFLQELNQADTRKPAASKAVPKTPDRFGNRPPVNDKTPLMANTTKKKRGPYNTKRRQEAKEALRKLQKRATRHISGKSIKTPTVHVRDLTYDWSSLGLDGTAAWNQQHPHDPPIAPVDLYYKAQSLKDALRTTIPPAQSPLYRCLKERGGQPTFLETQDAVVSADTEKVFLLRLAAQFRAMIKEESSAVASQTIRRRYQFMTAQELKDRVLRMEQDHAEWDSKERRTKRAAHELGLLDMHVQAVGPVRPAKKQRTKLLQEDGPSCYLMEHDKY